MGRDRFQSRPAPSSASAPAPRTRNDQRSQNFKAQGSQSQASVAQDSIGKPPCSKCGKLHLAECPEGGNGCYKCGQLGHYQRECPSWANKAQSSAPAPPVRGNQRDTTSSTNGPPNRLYAMGSRQDQEESPDVVMVAGTSDHQQALR